MMARTDMRARRSFHDGKNGHKGQKVIRAGIAARARIL
jgi:hypothetical protein